MFQRDVCSCIVPLNLSDTTSALDSFENFKLLPRELRQCIWSLAACIPRVVELNFNDQMEQWFCSEFSCAQPSGLLHASQESRKFYLENWVPLFPVAGGLHFTSQFSPLIKHATQYFNKDTDTLYLGPYAPASDNYLNKDRLALLSRGKEVTGLKYLACDEEQWSQATMSRDSLLDYFPHLREIATVVNDNCITFAMSGESSMLNHPRDRPRGGAIELMDVTQDDEHRQNPVDGVQSTQVASEFGTELIENSVQVTHACRLITRGGMSFVEGSMDDDFWIQWQFPA